MLEGLAAMTPASQQLSPALEIGPEPPRQRDRGKRADHLGEDESEHAGRRDAGERIGQRPRQRHGRIGERGRGGEPIGGGDVEADGIGRGALAREPRIRRSSAKGRRSRQTQPAIGPVRFGPWWRPARAAIRTSACAAQTPTTPPRSAPRCRPRSRAKTIRGAARRPG